MSLSLENPSSYYTMTRKYDLHYRDLEGDIEAEVVIIGGGFSGINTALELAERGITNVVVLEANYMGFGGSGRNGGHVMAGIGHDLENIEKDVGPEGLKAIFEISDMGASLIKQRIARYDVQADFRHGYGTAGMLLEYVPLDLKAWNHKKMLRLFPCLATTKIDLAWGGPMDCSLNLFPQVGTLDEYPNVFYVQGYSGFGVTPSQVIARVIADGMSGGSPAWDAMSSIPRKRIFGKDRLRAVLCSLGKVSRQLNAYRVGRR
ncbi:FAD-dependent oxidoreductase [Pseudomonas sp.]|uniref:FAD-dependent oxidoreductase n=1 Tax=Pseudomonas sp. TaxID=306 RepID=UPI0026DABCDD|nr:FAD-dependent oxidoreductase [Pseudomonas sp.]MDO4234206.1 FAD-dependent oxidoreductase [Pseudomonas sp.]